MNQSREVLLLWPPEVPAYFNAGHHLFLFLVAAHLRARFPHLKVTAVDAGVFNYTWKDIANLLASRPFHVIAIMNDFGSVTGLRPVIRYAKALQPEAKLMTFGRLSHQLPKFFRRYDLDAVVASGDYEASVANGVEYFLHASNKTAGLHLKTNGDWHEGPAGPYVPADQWAFPDVAEIPYEAYEHQYIDDRRKFCGIPERRELVVLAARGCPFQCSYCEVSFHQGTRERRRPVGAVVEYIKQSFASAKFEYVSFYAPTFTLDRRWVIELCENLESCHENYPWKCVTTLHHLDRELVERMGKAGCVRISVGLETLEPSAQEGLPKVKRKAEAILRDVAQWCASANIELNCFVIIGLPSETIEGARRTIEVATSLGARIRPTIYTPYHEMTEHMDEEMIGSFDRQLLPDTLIGDDFMEGYDLIFGRQSRVTSVMDQIPKRN